MTDHENIEQKKFVFPFDMKLSSDNRWVVMAKLIPWDELEEENKALFGTKKNKLGKPFRMALATLILKQKYEMTNRLLVALIQENPYLQSLIGLHKFTTIIPFKPLMIGNFEQNIHEEIMDKVNRILIKDTLKKILE
ncbi:transposase [Geminocystis sp. CENA526]|uniref:transposase n=1 Tax=Geminocystis sp. CENA526 TaxID=1355871 RepID=UPI003D6E3A9A